MRDMSIDPRRLPRLMRLSPAPKEDGRPPTFLADEGDWWWMNSWWKRAFGAGSPPRNVRRAFGGQTAAHCVVAAASVAPPDWPCHSLHLSFLRPGKMVETRYLVVTLRHGKSYATYAVTAYEGDDDKPLARATVSFHDCAREEGPSLHTSPTAEPKPPPAPAAPSPGHSSSAPGTDAWWSFDFGEPGESEPGVRVSGTDGQLAGRWWAGMSGRGEELSGVALWGAIAFLSDLQAPRPAA